MYGHNYSYVLLEPLQFRQHNFIQEKFTFAAFHNGYPRHNQRWRGAELNKHSVAAFHRNGIKTEAQLSFDF